MKSSACFCLFSLWRWLQLFVSSFDCPSCFHLAVSSCVSGKPCCLSKLRHCGHWEAVHNPTHRGITQVKERWGKVVSLSGKRVLNLAPCSLTVPVLHSPLLSCCGRLAGNLGLRGAVCLLESSFVSLSSVWDMANPTLGLASFGSVCCSSKTGIIMFTRKITVWPVFYASVSHCDQGLSFDLGLSLSP